MKLEWLCISVPLLALASGFFGLMTDLLVWLTVTGSVSSVFSFLLWLYSRQLADLYKTERTQRMRVRREMMMRASEDEKNSRTSRPQAHTLSNPACELIFDETEKTPLLGLSPRTVPRIRPVLSAFLSLILSVAALVCFICAMFVVSAIVTESSR